VEEVKRMISHKSINVQTEVITAMKSIVTEIVNYATRGNIDLIVVGTREMSGIKRMLLGSSFWNLEIGLLPCFSNKVKETNPQS
jgi:nucleotide-binding universal stress UspA family protein